jgi:hypothetical protein
MAAIMMLVVTAASAAALFAQVHKIVNPRRGNDWLIDAPAVLLIAIGLTAVAIATVRKHTSVQMMIQMTITCLMLLVLFHLLELQSAKANWPERAVRYWFQACFALTVVLPLLAKRLVASEMEPGPRRDWWQFTFESVLASFANLILVLIGVLIQLLAVDINGSIF